jgi:Leucine-rich repeat (LRR) protein
LNLENKNLSEFPDFSSLYWDPILNQITSIKLWHNNITKIDKEYLYMIPNLNNIDLSNNKITSINIDLKLLKTINLSNNNIKTWTWFLVWESIKNLNLSNNWLENLEWFNKYKNLVAVDLSNNKLNTGDLWKFWWNKKLEYLLVQWNNININLLQKIQKINLKYLNAKRKKIDSISIQKPIIDINTGKISK